MGTPSEIGRGISGYAGHLNRGPDGHYGRNGPRCHSENLISSVAHKIPVDKRKFWCNAVLVPSTLSLSDFGSFCRAAVETCSKLVRVLQVSKFEMVIQKATPRCTALQRST